MDNGYFIVKTIQGKLFTFDERCNEVLHSDENLCIFRHIENKTPQHFATILAMIPYSQIAYIYKYPADVMPKR